ncbi:hypothetical protein FNF31_06363 [Cafeteria roenbergensis]|uniref:Myosin motor domain-containing protein n=1 Tax=Cafeteria roenbergensis TaxID=33653 RepID=A0A5A8CQ98_CAFRO|nr:hypothetical protein FNF31_06363 [Cafeteria roenbergensis]
MADADSQSETPKVVRRARRGSVTITEASTGWLKQQAARMEAERAALDADDGEDDVPLEGWNWIPDEAQGYVPAQYKGEGAGGTAMYLALGKAEPEAIAVKAVGSAISAMSSLKRHVDDMVKMEEVNEAAVLQNVRLRFERRIIYTNIGSILVSVNPFEHMDGLYTADQVALYGRAAAEAETRPHVFAIASNAFRGMAEEGLPQAIIISGESGAGKTEATKKCLQYMAEVAGSAAHGLDKRLLAANPILEAFGNAKTVRNNNSSRFGKWMVVRFLRPPGAGQGLAIGGCHITNYLLERSRLVSPAPDERTYHVFYQLLAGADEAMQAELRLRPPSDCALFTRTTSCLAVPGMDDSAEWEDVVRSFGVLGFEEESVTSVLRCVSGVLQLADIDFEHAAAGSDGSGAVVTAGARQRLEDAAALLGLEPADLERELTRRGRSAGAGRSAEVTYSPLDVEASGDSRWALVTALYSKLFDWLVQEVNKSLAGSPEPAVGGAGAAPASAAAAAASAGAAAPGGGRPSLSIGVAQRTVGILDIFGFEIFQHNSFEQLCINYCNEKLQQLFNNHVFKEEERVYKAEGIDFSDVVYTDNQSVVDLIEGARPPGLLRKLDDMTLGMRATDAQLVASIVREHNASPDFIAVLPARVKTLGLPRDALPFGVKHYAADVVYDARGFISKNKDLILPNVVSLMQGSTLPMISEQLFCAEDDGTPVGTDSPIPASPAVRRLGAGGSGGAGRRRGKDTGTQAKKFRTQLESLMQTLGAAEPHYIRCIKPNAQKRPGVFEGSLCLEQLRYSGIFDAVRIRQQGFPFRWSYADFVARYRCCTDVSEEVAAAMAERGVDASASGWARKRGAVPWDEAFHKGVARAIVHRLAERLGVAGGCFRDVRFGKTMVLYRAEAHRRLTELRGKATRPAAHSIQRAAKGIAAKRAVWRLRALRVRLARATRLRDLQLLEEAVAEAEALSERGDAVREGAPELPAAYAALPVPADSTKQVRAGGSSAPGLPASVLRPWLSECRPWPEGVEAVPEPPGLARLAASPRPLGPLPELPACKSLARRLRLEADAKEAVAAALEASGEARSREGVAGARTALEAALETLSSLGMSDGEAPGAAEARALLAADARWTAARDALEAAVEAYDRGGIEGARAQAAELAEERLAAAGAAAGPSGAADAAGWATLGGGLEDRAAVVLEEIAREEAALVDLRAAIGSGALTDASACSLAEADIRLAGLLAPPADGEVESVAETGVLDEAALAAAAAAAAPDDADGSSGAVAVSVRWDHLAGPAEALRDAKLRTPDGLALVRLASLLTMLRRAVGGSAGESSQKLQQQQQQLSGGSESGPASGVDWAAVDASVDAFDELPSIPESAAAEVAAARAASHARAMARRLRLALLLGQPRGAVGDMQCDALEFDELVGLVRKAATSGSGGASSSAEAGKEGTARGGVMQVPAVAELVSSAALVAECRKHAKAGDWDALEAVLATEEAGSATPLAEAEILRFSREVRERRAEQRLSAALSEGGLAGRVGRPDRDSVSTAGLERAVEASGSARGPRAVALLEFATAVVLPLRRAVLAGDWDEAAAMVAGVEDDQVPAECAAEVELAVGIAEERAVVAHLVRGLSLGRVACAAGSAEIDAAAVETAPLLSEVRTVGPLERRTALSRVLTVAAESTASMRAAVQQGSWAEAAQLAAAQLERLAEADAAEAEAEALEEGGSLGVEAALAEGAAALPADAAERAAAGAGSPLDAVRAECRLVRREAARRAAVQAVLDALSVGALSGTAAGLRTEGVDGDALERAAAQASALDRVGSADDVRLVETGALVARLRTMLVHGNWQDGARAMAEAAARWAGAEGPAEGSESAAQDGQLAGGAKGDGAAAGLEGAARLAHPAGQRELHLAVSVVRAAAAGDALAAALASHRVRGRPDGLAAGPTMAEPLRRAAAVAAALPRACVVPRVAALHRAAVLLADARQALSAWTELVDSAPWGSKATASADRQALDDDEAALSGAPVFGELEHADTPGAAAASSQAAKHRPRDEVKLYDPVAAAAAAADSPSPGASGPAGADQAGGGNGLLTPDAARENEAWAKVEAATAALMARFGSAGSAGSAGPHSAMAAPRSQGEQDRGLAGSADAEARRLCQTEGLLLQDAAHNRRLVSSLRAALRRGRATGSPGAIRVLDIETAPLSKAVELAAELGVNTDAADRLLRTARVVLRARRGLRDGDEAAVGSALSEAEALAGPGGGLGCVDSAAREELGLCQANAAYQRVISRLTSAMAKGGPVGVVGALDVSQLETAEVEAALNEAQAAVGGAADTPAVKALVETAHQLVRVRRLLAEGRWEAAEAAVEDALAVQAGSAASPADPGPLGGFGGSRRGGRPQAGPARAELELVLSDTSHRRACTDLSVALRSGGIAGEPGAVDVSAVRVDLLARAMDQAKEAGCRSARSRALQAAAWVVRCLRAALMSGDWAAAIAALDSPDGQRLLSGVLGEVGAARVPADEASGASEAPQGPDATSGNAALLEGTRPVHEPGSAGEASAALSAARTEALLAAAEARNRAARRSLLDALASGGARADDATGHLLVDGVETSDLADALAGAMGAGLQLPEGAPELRHASGGGAGATAGAGGSGRGAVAPGLPAIPVTASLIVLADAVLCLRNALTEGSRGEAEAAIAAARRVPGVADLMASAAAEDDTGTAWAGAQAFLDDDEDDDRSGGGDGDERSADGGAGGDGVRARDGASSSALGSPASDLSSLSSPAGQSITTSPPLPEPAFANVNPGAPLALGRELYWSDREWRA